MQNLPTIVCSVVPHKKQRYSTSGDYFKKKGKVHIVVSKTTANHEFLIMMHELIEWYLITQKGVSIEDIDKFDMEFEKNRPQGNTDEPGDDPRAPYYHEHQFATSIEKQVAKQIGVNWDKYDAHIKAL